MSAIPRPTRLDAFPLQPREARIEAAINFAAGLQSQSLEHISAAWVVAARCGAIEDLGDWELVFGTRVFSPAIASYAPWLTNTPPRSPSAEYFVGKALADFKLVELAATARMLLVPERFPRGWPEAEEIFQRAAAALRPLRV